MSPSFKLETVFPTAVRASMLQLEQLKPHPCGSYFQTVPVDSLTGLAAITYERADELGAMKIDFLNLATLESLPNRQDLLELIEIEPDWTLLRIPSVVDKLFQIHNQFTIVEKLRPRSILELADCLALIRPQKRYLLDKYMENPVRWRVDLYSKGGGEGYGFKKGHAIAYAMLVVVQLHMIKANLL